MYRRIMVPLDGSHAAEAAVSTGADIAKRTGATLHLAYVVSWISELTDTSSPGKPRPYLNRIAGEVAVRYGVNVQVDLLSDAINGVAYGKPPRRAVAQVLREFVHDDDIDLTVMTTHGRGGYKRLWLGSVADGMLRTSNGNILMLKSSRPILQSEPIMAERILIPVDVAGSDEEVIARTVEFGELYNAEFTLLHIASPVASLVSASADELLEGGLVTTEMAQESLERLAMTLRDTGHRVETVVATMPFVAPEILAYSQDHQFDMIAIGTRGPTSVQRLLLGSVSDKLMRGAKVPVFACNVSLR